MIPRPCLCHDQHQYLNVKCPDVAGHQPESTYPYHERSIIKAAQAYHADVMAGLIPIIGHEIEPFVPVGVRYVPRPVERVKVKVSLVKAGRRRVVEFARPMGPGDVWPGYSRELAALPGARASYARGILSDVYSQACEVCGVVVRVKMDGSLYLHPVRAPERCEGTQGVGAHIPREVESVVVRGAGWVASWTDGATERIYVDALGRVSIDQFREWLVSR